MDNISASSGQPLTIRIGGAAMSTMQGSEITSDPVAYDGGSKGARDAYEALTHATGRRAGRGWTYTTETSADGAAVIADYCRTVGETFAAESELETKAEGRALLIVAERIEEQLRERQQ